MKHRMRNKIALASFLSIICLLFMACSNNDEKPETVKAPALLKSNPADGTTELLPGNISIRLTFDQVIILAKPHQISINEETITDISVSSHVLIIQTVLQAGMKYELTIPENTIQGENGLFAVPIHLFFETQPEPSVEWADLAVKNPSPETIKLYNFLKENYGKKILSGAVANVSWNINEAEWVHHHTGKYPALNAFDYIFLYASPANWIDYGNTQVVEDWWNNNGIVSCMWHWNVPKRSGATDYSFYTEETDFDIQKALQEGTPENAIITADLNKTAAYLLLLKNKNIPVLWRPLHEAKGNIGKYPNGKAWFWWGAGGAESFKSLWRLMFNIFKNKGLNNLIWVWTSENNDFDWYPGDEYVDIIGRDMYNQSSPAGLFNEYNTLQKQYPKKIITLSECGNVAKIPEQLDKNAFWSWFMPWYDYERTQNTSSSAFNQTNHQHGNIDFWNNAWNDERVISREKVPNLKNE